MNWKTLFNPFEKYSEYKLLLFGLLSLVLTTTLSYYSNSRMISILRFDDYNLTFVNAFLYCVISIFIGIIVFYLLGKTLNKRTRFLDITNMILVASAVNIPLLLLGRIGNLDKMIQPDYETQNLYQYTINIILISIFILFILSLVAYSFTLFLNGFRTATNIKKWPQIVLFVFIFFITAIICQTLIPQLKF